MPAGTSASATAAAPAGLRAAWAAFLPVLGPSVAFAITGVDPLLLTLNLPAVSRALDVPASLVGFLGGAATPATKP